MTPSSNAADTGRTAPARRSTFGRVLAGTLAGVLSLNLFVIGLAVYTLHQSRELYRRQTEVNVKNLSTILAADVGGLMGDITLTLQNVGDEARRELASGGWNGPAMTAFLRRAAARLPQARGLCLADAQGRVRYSAHRLALPAPRVTGRPFFAYARTHAEPRVFIEHPVQGRRAGQWVLLVPSRFTAPDGALGGVVVASIPAADLLHRLSEIDVGAHGVVVLFQIDDGHLEILARHTPIAPNGRVLGRATVAPMLLSLLAAGKQWAVYHTHSGADQVLRTLAFRRIPGLPLLVVVGIADQDALAAWRREAVVVTLYAAFFVLGTLLVSGLFLRGFRQRLIAREVASRKAASYMAALQQARAESEAARLRSELILASAGEGICGIDPRGRVMFSNPAAQAMFGWENDGAGLDLHEETHHHRPDGSAYPAAECLILHTLRDGQTRRIHDELYWRRDGSSFPVEYTSTPIIQDGTIRGAVNVFRDVTEAKAVQDQLTFTNNSLRLLSELATLSDLGQDRKIALALDKARHHLGLEIGVMSRTTDNAFIVEECVGSVCPEGKGTRVGTLDTCCSPLQEKGVLAIRALRNGAPAGVPPAPLRPWAAYIGVPLDVHGRIYGVLGFASAAPFPREFTEADREFMRLLGRWVGSTLAEEETRAQLEYLATTDELTGIANRRRFMTLAQREFERSRRYGRSLALLMLDVDFFKGVNDTYGHAAGDVALAAVTHAIQEKLRSADAFGRLGGEEFAVLLAETDSTGACELAERLRVAVERLAIPADDETIHLTVSIGVAEIDRDEDVEQLLHRADLALYGAKKSGRNRVVVSPEGSAS
ncbi:MAG: diguanylate cyclase [Betaproteobacteria bacterium]|nr:diguanylate cyclase [Betaproteobacteria bacterium]